MHSAVGVVFFCATGGLSAQTVDTASTGIEPATYLFAGVGAFIPFSQSFRLNYSTNFAGLPVELIGGLGFPVNASVMAPVTFRYLSRKANFVGSTTVHFLSIEPGVRVYLEKQRRGDLRVFAGAEAIFANATVHGLIDASQDGAVQGSLDAQKDYIDEGLGFDLGFTYAFANATALDALVHTSLYLGSPLTHGGLGNVGGVSLDISYRFGF